MEAGCEEVAQAGEERLQQSRRANRIAIQHLRRPTGSIQLGRAKSDGSNPGYNKTATGRIFLTALPFPLLPIRASRHQHSHVCRNCRQRKMKHPGYFCIPFPE